MNVSLKWRVFLAACTVMVALTAAANAQDVVGRWRDNTDGGIVEYRSDGTFLMSHPRMRMSGRWTMASPGVLKFTVNGQSAICSVEVNGRVKRMSDCPMVDANTGRIIYETTATRID